MAHIHRFHVDADTLADEVQLSDEEGHHAIHVVRVAKGDKVALFDGHGHEWMGHAKRVTKREVTVAVESERFEPPTESPVTLVQAWLRREKAIDELVRYSTALGVAQIRFFRAKNSERDPRAHHKLQRTAIETGKQCGRLWLPEFVALRSMDDALADCQGDLLVGAIGHEPVPMAEACGKGAVTLLVGPEGDFTDEEVDAAIDKGAKPVSLGPVIFRSEVAANVLLTLVQYHRGELGPKV